MNTTIKWIAGGALLLGVGAGLVWIQKGRIKDKQGQVSAPQQTQAGNTREVSSLNVSPSHVVAYSAEGFSPKVLRVAAGETVAFQNLSSRSLWPAANPHPTHTGYPTRGGCGGSTFDSCAMVGSGQSWSFRFDIKGSWRYHNHLYPTFGGVIVVE